MLRPLLPTTVLSFALACTLALPAMAETFEVKMLTRAADGSPMVFEPAYLRLEPGDSIKFLASQKGHNAESMKKMMPKGAKKFRGKINQEIEVSFDVNGWYGIQCKPHYAMGMVMVVQVGDVELPEKFLAGRIPKRAKQRFNHAIALAE